MGKALIIGCGTSVGLASGDECNLFGYASDTITEANTQASATEACTFTRLGFRIISGGSGTNTLQFRDAGANGQQVASRSGQGIAEDTTHSDALSAGDLFNLAYTDTGTDSGVGWIKGHVEFSSGHGGFHGVAAFSGVVCDVASATRFIALAGNLATDGTATEANAAFKVRGYTSWEALQVRVTANARTNDSTFINRINGATGAAACLFAAGATGLVTDTTVGDSLADGDTICAGLTLGSGVQDLTVAFVVATLKSSDNEQDIWAGNVGGLARAASATAMYSAVGGFVNSASGTETQLRAAVGFAGVAKNLRCYLSANTYTTDATLKLMQNGTAVMTTTLTASGGAGWYENTADSVSFDDNDELSFEIDEGTSGSITIHMIGVTFAPAAAEELNLESGSYSVTGAVATVAGAMFLSANPGSYDVTGFVTTLTKGSQLNLESGSYTVTGVTATVIGTLSVVAEAGSYDTTGFPATLAKGSQLSLDSGAYNITGVEAIVVGALSITATAGDYSVTGVDASLIKGSQISLDPGLYILTGADVTLLDTGGGAVVVSPREVLLLVNVGKLKMRN